MMPDYIPGPAQGFVDPEVSRYLSDELSRISDSLREARGVVASPERATDTGTDTYESATNSRIPPDGNIITRDFQSANTTTTPTLDGKTMTTKDGSALWAGAVSGVHELQYDSGADTYLVLDVRMGGRTIVYAEHYDITDSSSIDNTSGIQDAIDFAATQASDSKQYVVDIPSGSYGVTGLTLKSNVYLRGTGRSQLTLLDSSDSPVLVGKGVKNIDISGLLIDGNKQNQGTPPGSGDWWDGISIRDSTDDGSGTASTFITIHDCKIVDAASHGIRFLKGQRCDAYNNHIITPADDGIGIELNSARVSVHDNLIEETTASGATSIGAAVEIEGGTNDISVVNNRLFDGAVGVQLDIDSGGSIITRVLVQGNVLRNQTDRGISISGDSGGSRCTQVDVSHNALFNTAEEGIFLTSTADCNVTGNMLEQCGPPTTAGGAISIRKTGWCLIAGNQVHNSDNRGIYLIDDTVFAVVVDGNIVTESGADGIRSEITQAHIINNGCFDNDDTGIVVIGDDSYVAGNLCWDTGSGPQTRGIIVDAAASDVRLEGNSFRSHATERILDNGTRTRIDGVAVDSGNAEEPTAANYERGEMVDWTDTGDASGDGVYLKLDGSSWAKIA